MNRNTLIGAGLLGLGSGLLTATLFPWLSWFWPLVALLVAAMLWRRAGTVASRIALGVVALSWALSTVDFSSERLSVPGVGGTELAEDTRALETLTATEEQLEMWQNARTFKIVNSVGTVSVEGDTELAAEIRYRTSRRRSKAPAALNAVFDEATRTLTLTGIDPEASERERRGLSADIILSIPAAASLDVLTGIADVDVAAVGETSLKTNVGNLRSEGVLGNLKAVSETGDIRVYNSQAEVDIRTNVGSLYLTFEQPVRAPIRAKTKVGDITLNLPESSPVALHALSELRHFSGGLERVTPTEGRLLLGDESVEVSLQTSVGEVGVKTY